MKINKAFFIATSVVFSLTSCSIPQQSILNPVSVSTESKNHADNQAIGSSSVKPEVIQKQDGSKFVKRKSQINHSGLENSLSSEEQNLNELLKNYSNNNSFSTSNLLSGLIDLVGNTKIAHFTPKNTVQNTDFKIPKTGTFQLKVIDGPNFKILDSDATDDSSITLQMPTGTFKTFIYLERNNNSKLTVQDKLYSVTDTLQESFFERWLTLGKRPNPVPLDWESSDGRNFTLQFTAENIKGFYIAWQKTTETANFPPGIASITASGGTVELPGVGKIVVPAGALNAPTTIKIKEVLEAPLDNLFPGVVEYEGGTTSSIKEYITPVIEVTPKGMELEKPLAIYLNINAARLGNNHPGILERYAKVDENFIDIHNSDDPTLNGPLAEERTLNTPFFSYKLGTFYQTIDSYVKPQDDLLSLSVEFSSPANPNGQNFSIQQFFNGPKKTVCNTKSPYKIKVHTPDLSNPTFVSFLNETKKDIEDNNKYLCDYTNHHPPLNPDGNIPIWLNGLEMKKITVLNGSINYSVNQIDMPITSFNEFPNDPSRQLRIICLHPYAKAMANHTFDQVPHELFHLFTSAGMKQADFLSISNTFVESSAEAFGLWRSLDVTKRYTSDKLTTANIEANQNLMHHGIDDRNTKDMKGVDNQNYRNPAYSSGGFYLSLSQNSKKYGRAIIFDWINYLNELAYNKQLISRLSDTNLLQLLNERLTLLDAKNEPLNLSKLYYQFTLDSLRKEHFFNTNPEPYHLKDDVVSSSSQTIDENTFQTKAKPLTGSLTKALSTRFHEINVHPALLSGAKKTDIAIYLDTVNIPKQDILHKFARYVTIAAMKKVGSTYKVVDTYPLIDQLTIGGDKKFIKIIKTKNLNYDKLVLSVPNTTFGTNFQSLTYTFKTYRGSEVYGMLNTTTPGRVKFIGDGFGSEAEVYFERIGGGKYTSAYGKVIQGVNDQSIEIDLPSDIANNGKLFIRSQGSDSNEKAYTIDACKKEFSVHSSIKEQIKCIY